MQGIQAHLRNTFLAGIFAVVPIAVTIAAAAGPPRNMAARIGADPTDTATPLGSRTGIALAASVATVQYTKPIGPPIPSRIGNRKIAAAITRIAAATVARIRRVTLAFTGGVLLACAAGVYHGPPTNLEHLRHRQGPVPPMLRVLTSARQYA